jgi:glucose 1-dehydrogenase
VLALGAAGASVCVDYVMHQEITAEEREQVLAMEDRIIAVKADVSKVDEVQMLVDETVKAFGRLDVLVNNAGIETRTSVLDTTEAQYDRVLDINLKGAFFGTQFAAKQMVKQGEGGRIINISSIHEDWPMTGNAPYCLSKGGMRMLTRNAGVELAPHGVTVVGVGPGAVATPINVETMQDPKLMSALKAAIPLGRMAEPKEIADLVVWLASDQASYVTATTFIVDGGMMQFSPGL